MNKCCIIIPSYKEKLEGSDKLSFDRCINIFGGNRPIKVVIPNNISTEFYEAYGNTIELIKVNPQWMNGISSYNSMCCNKEFYKLFKDYEYILIYQTDCWIFEDKLDYFIKLGYDWYGAPWPHNNDHIGNGGLSLRKVSKMIEITSKYEFKGDSLEGAEDTWFCLTHGNELNICDVKTACQFSIENPAKKYLEKIDGLPMGLHGKIVRNLLWDNDGTKFVNYSNKLLNKKKMNILFDSQIYDLQQFGGISRMYVDIHNEWSKNNNISSKFSVTNTKNIYLSNTKPYSYGNDNNRELSVKMISDGNYDVLYPTFFSTYFLKHLNGKPFVMSVHDMIPELYPQYFKQNDLQIVGKREMVKYASAIEVPTETTKRDLIKILNVEPSKIHVIGRGINDDFGKLVYYKNIVDYKYVLYVGQRNAYKRFDWFIKYSSEFFNKHTDIKLLCTGNDFTSSEKMLLEKYNMLDKTVSMKVDDIELATLYANAEFFVYTSEYEGFGLPILESYKMNCIALLNSNDCFKEVTLGKGTFFNLKENESDICKVMEKTISLTKGRREKIIKTQNEILSHYSIKSTAEKLRKMVEWVVNEKNNSKLDIFICTHKEFKPLVHNKVYKTINANDINGDIAENGLKGSFYSEILTYKHVADSKDLKDYVGFCHYRKYWKFLDSIPDVDTLLSQYDAIVAKPLVLKQSVRKQYELLHNIEDLEIVEKIINEKYKEYSNPLKIFLNGNILIPYNMFIMKKDDFKEYIKFIFDVLDDYIKVVGIDIIKRIEDNKDKYLKSIYPNNTIEYQYRIGGYLAERLTNVFLIKKYTKMKTFPVIFTENKYKKPSQ